MIRRHPKPRLASSLLLSGIDLWLPAAQALSAQLEEVTEAAQALLSQQGARPATHGAAALPAPQEDGVPPPPPPGSPPAASGSLAKLRVRQPSVDIQEIGPPSPVDVYAASPPDVSAFLVALING